MSNKKVTVTIKKTIRYHIAEKIVFIAVLFGNESLRTWLLKDIEDNPKRYLKVKRQGGREDG